MLYSPGIRLVGADMNIGMLWFDNDSKKSVIDRADGAGAYYHKKHGRFPNLCFVHPSMLPEFEQNKKHLTDAGIEMRVSRSILPNHFWLGSE